MTTPSPRLSDPNNSIEEIEASADDAGLRLDKFLANRLPGLSRSRLKALIENGAVFLSGRTMDDPAYRIKAGDTIAVEAPAAEPAIPEGEAIPLNIVFEDDALIVIDKPAGLVVHPAAGHATGTLVNALIAHCGDSLSGIGGVKRPGIVHRLDKDTSGLMVAAKTDAAHRGLAKQFADHGREGTLTRRYRAFVWGAPRASGVIDLPLGRHPTNRLKMAVRENGRHAITHYRVTDRYPSRSSLAAEIVAELLTGRTHQVRVHFARIGHPLIGDRLYGSGHLTKAQLLPQEICAAVSAFDRQALHAEALGFLHPITGAAMKFNSALPDDMTILQQALTEL